MLAEDVKIVDIDPFQYENLLSVFLGENKGGKTHSELIVFYRDNRAVHAVHTVKGPLSKIRFRGPENLEALAEEYGVEHVVCLETGSIRRVFADAQTHLKHDQSLWEQSLACRAAATKELNSGIHIYPDPFRSIPELPNWIVKIGGMLLPRRIMLAMSVFDNGKIWTSVIAEIVNGEISLLTTTDSLAPVEISGTDIAQNASHIIEGIHRVWGKPTAGVFMERTAFEQLVADPKPISGIARLVKEKWIYVNPFPQRLKLILAATRFIKF